MKKTVEIQEGVEVNVVGQQVIVKGPVGEVTRIFPSSKLKITSEKGIVNVENIINTQAIRALVSTFKAHINNMVDGVRKPFIYKLKVTSVHFPMNITLSGKVLSIANFLGSKKPIIVNMPNGADVSVDADIITISSIDIETAGMAATRIEQATRITNKDRRVFQDGIFITEKAGKPIR